MEQQQTESDIDRRIRDMVEADMRRAVMIMTVMNEAFDIINRIPGPERGKPTVRTSER